MINTVFVSADTVKVEVWFNNDKCEDFIPEGLLVQEVIVAFGKSGWRLVRYETDALLNTLIFQTEQEWNMETMTKEVLDNLIN